MDEETKEGLAEVEDKFQVTEGAFIDSLKRTAPKIRADRAASIAEDAQVMYRREIEDLEVNIRRKERTLENMLDMSPDNITSLKVATDFDAKEYVGIDMKLAFEIRNDRIKLDIVKGRYNYLFGGGM